MGQFLRDQKLRNLSIDEATLDRLNDAFIARVALHNVALPEDSPNRAILFYVIRFDEKGFRFVNIDDVKKYFREARDVERIIFTVESATNRNSGSLFGTHCDLCLDANDHNKCWLVVAADDKGWADATFAYVTEVLVGHKSWSGLVRTPWTALLIQLLGVVVGFGFSLWAALKIAPLLNVENAFVVTLFFAFLVYSNVWGYVNQQIGRLIDFAFPNIRFKRAGKDWLHTTVQTVIFALAVTFAAYLIDKCFTFVGSVVATFIK